MSTAPPPVFLHIGAMKTGTTFLQSLMSANRDQLAAAGFLLPGRTWGHQVRAAEDLLGLPVKGGRPTWDDIATEMLGHRGRASVYSMEFLGFADRAQARRAVRSLAGADVHVVVTVRDAAATVPAQWQTAVHNGDTMTWADFEAGVRKAMRLPAGWGRLWREESVRHFSRRQDIGRMVRVWSRGVGPDRVHVVTVPPPGVDRMLLWRRFAGVVGIDPAVCSTPPKRVNESLGYASTELLRRVNEHLRDLPQRDYEDTVKEHLALRVLSARAESEERARLDPVTYQAALAWNARTRAAVVRAGVDVVGDLSDLPVDPSPETLATLRNAQRSPTQQELLDAAREGVTGMRALVGRRRRRLRRRTGVADAGSRLRVRPRRWTGSADPVDAAAVDLARLCRVAVDLQAGLLAARAGAS